MEDSVRRKIGNTVAAILVADAAMHVYWLTGATWPAANVRELSFALLGAEFPFTPRVLIPLAIMLCVAAAAVLVRSRHVGNPWVRFCARAITAAVCIGAGARAILGLLWITGVGIDGNATLYWLNVLLYTPLCLVLSVGSYRLARHAVPAIRRVDVKT